MSQNINDLGFELKKIVSDEDISQHIYAQACHLIVATDLSEQEKTDLFKIIINVMQKLSSVKYHRDNLSNIIVSKLSQKQEAETKDVYSDITSGAEYETEAFILQGKSCLDVLAKIFKPLFNLNLHSYGSAGEKVKKALEKGIKHEFRGKAETLIKMIEQDKEWIGKWFKSERDSICHYKTIESTGFQYITRDTNETIICPKTKQDIPLQLLLKNLYSNLFTFCEDFIALSLGMRFRSKLILILIPEEKRDKEIPLKYGIGL